MSTTTTTRPLPPPWLQPPLAPPQYELDLILSSAKHLKNVNWKNGDLKPYAILWVDPDHKLTSKSDDSGDIKPVWNQRFHLPLTSPLSHSTLTLEIFHCNASQTPKPFVGSLHILLSGLPEPNNHTLVRTFPLLRPSGRPQGKIRLKLSIKEIYHFTPHYHYNYPGYYYPPPPTSLRYGAPSAPMEAGVGAVAGGIGGIVLDDEVRSEGGGRVVEDNFVNYPLDY